MTKKMSQRAEQLLLLVDYKTVRSDPNGALVRYYVPSGGEEYCVLGTRRPTTVWVQGAGDAAVLRGLEARGLIERPRGATSACAYATTEEGRLVVEALLAEVRGRPDSDKYYL